MSSHDLGFDERDLAEATRLPKDKPSFGVVAGFVVAVVLFLALLVHGSLPELSPEEIVAMDGYEGEQPTRHIFNIHSLGDKSKDASAPAQVVVSKTDAAPTSDLPVAVTEPVPVASESATTATIAPATVEDTVVVEELPIAQTEEIPQQEVVVATVEPPVVEPVVEPVTVQVVVPDPVVVEVVEPTQLPIAVTEPIPAPVVVPVTAPRESNTISFTKPEQTRIIAAKATTPTINEASDTVVLSSVVAVEPVPLPVRSSISLPSSSSEGNKGRLLPLRSIVNDATELKVSPSIGSETLLSLNRGSIVTAFERRGPWIQVGVNDGSSITGFVLETSLERVKTKNPG